MAPNFLHKALDERVINCHVAAIGHFVPEQLPKLLMLNASLPDEVPILVPDCAVTRRYLDPLIAAGLFPKSRIWYQRLGALTGATISADLVYTIVNSHFSGPIEGDASYRLARAAFGAASPLPMDGRTHVLVIKRQHGKARAVDNSAAMVRAIEAAVAGATDGRATKLRVLEWKPDKDLRADVAAFRRAALVVGPHGAGLANIVFASEGTPVIELCFDNNNMTKPFDTKIACPPMYGMMGVNLGLPYWVLTARGTYASMMQADVAQVRAAVSSALDAAYGGGFKARQHAHYAAGCLGVGPFSQQTPLRGFVR